MIERQVMAEAAQRARIEETDSPMGKFDDSEIERQDWRESRQLVMRTLERVENKLEDIDQKVGSDMTEMKVEIAMIKTKVALYAAAIATAASVLLSLLIGYLTKR